MRSVNHENERLKEENETLRKQAAELQINLHEHQIKLDSYTRDYERYFEETKRLRETVSTLRDGRDQALSEVKRVKSLYHDRTNELNDECNLKLAQLENQLLETRERAKVDQENAFVVIRKLEQVGQKYKNEHLETVTCYEKALRAAKAEARHMHEQVVELKGQLKMEKENNDENMVEKLRKQSKSKEREKSSKSKSKKE